MNRSVVTVQQTLKLPDGLTAEELQAAKERAITCVVELALCVERLGISLHGDGEWESLYIESLLPNWDVVIDLSHKKNVFTGFPVVLDLEHYGRQVLHIEIGPTERMT